MKLRAGMCLLFLLGAAGCSSSTSPGTGVDSGAPGGDASTPTIDSGASNDGSVPQKDSGSSPPDATAADSGSPDATASADATTDATTPTGDGGPGPDTTVTAFSQTLICFGSGGTGPCSRTVDAQASFPATGTYKSITMHVTLDCPANGCDPWDRVGSIYLVQGGGGDGSTPETLIELGRFITPYGITPGTNNPPAWDIDVTELRPLLAGQLTLRAFIDTWVPQGNPGQYGGGWVLGATFQMSGGVPAKVPVAVVPISVWKTTGKEPTGIVYGDASQPISTSLPPQTVTVPPGATSFGVRSTITGHGQGNLDNCAEFCPEQHTWTVGSMANTSTMWRTDCANFPSSGTFMYSRAGWCPGADVHPWDFDVTSQVGSGSSVTISYGVSDYTNTCNGGQNLCTGCQSGESCPYDGGGHTQPFYYVQALLIGFQ